MTKKSDCCDATACLPGRRSLLQSAAVLAALGTLGGTGVLGGGRLALAAALTLSMSFLTQPDWSESRSR